MGKKGGITAVWIALIGVVVLAFVLIAYYIAFPEYRQPKSRLWNSSLGYPALLRHLGLPIPVEVATTQIRKINLAVSAVGTVQFLNEVPVGTEMPGIILDVPVINGDHVARGDVLMTISTGGSEIRLARIYLDLQTSAYTKAKSDYDRDSVAFKKGLISETLFAYSQEAYREAEFNKRTAEEDLDKAVISRSQAVLRRTHTAALQNLKGNSDPTGNPPDPVPRPRSDGIVGGDDRIPIVADTDGTVIGLTAHVGESITQATGHLLSIGDRLTFAASVDQRYFSLIKTRQAAKIFLRAKSDITLTGQVIRIDPVIVNQTNQSAPGQTPSYRNTNTLPFTFTAYIDFDDPEISSQIAKGMNGYCIFDNEIERLAVPQNALLRYSGGQGVVAVDKDDKVYLVPVSYEESSEGWIAITSGLQPGDMVIVAGQTGLIANDSITVQ
jgi:multidrug efflux pump subunit AcrA (membrane-fusion protein)